MVLELAASSEVHTRPRWVASLCTVCRACQLIITPILYDLVRMDIGNLGQVFATAVMNASPFRFTRSLVITTDASTAIYNYSDGFAAFRTAFTRMRSFTGSPFLFIDIIITSDPCAGPPVTSAFLTDVGDWKSASIYAGHALIRAVAPLPRLHISFGADLEPPPDSVVHALHTEYLIVDMYNAPGHEALSLITQQFLRVRSLKRLLFRPRMVPRIFWAPFAAALSSIASDMRDGRICLDDTDVPLDEDSLQGSYEALDCEDARAGDSLWLRGSPLYVPSSDP